MNKKKVYIIGAGPIGLVTGWQLLLKGVDVEIFEKNNIVGGMCRTWKWGEYLVDTGPHIFHTPDKKLSDFWEKEFGDLFIKGDFWCKNVSGEKFDKYWDYPISWESISRYPNQLKKKILEEIKNNDPEKKASAKNYFDYITAEVGPTLTKMFYTTYPEKIWGIETKKMTPEWAPKRIEFRTKVTPFYHHQWNAVGKFGTGSIYERIKDKIIKLGGKINFNSTLTNIIYNDKEIKELHFLNNKKIVIRNKDTIISSLPITLTAKLFGYKSSLKFRGIKSVYMSYSKKEILPKNLHWLYYGSKKIDFNRVTEPKRLSPYVAPKNKSYLTAEITYSKGDIIDKIDDKKLIKKISEQLAKVGLVNKKDFLEGSVNSEPFVYPLMFKGYQNELAKTKSHISKFSQLYSIGTGGDYNYADSQILFEKAFDVVDLITEKSSKYTQVIREVKKSKFNKVIKYKNKFIGDNYNAFIIAEAGLNHNGSLKMAKKLVDRAKKCGCDAIKFQSYLPNSRISSQVKAVHYAEKVNNLEEDLNDMFNRLALNKKDQINLFHYAREKGIEIFSTPFDFESVDLLESLNVGMYKIASMDLVNLPLISYIAEKNKLIFLSTGMSNLGQIEDAVEAVRKTGNENLVLLHCNSSYPAPISEINLKIINTLKNAFEIPVGLSDHTMGLFVSHTAIALGANVIERHFTLNKTLEGPDHMLSSEPKEMSELVKLTKSIPLIIGSGNKKIQPTEYDTINTQRKSIYASKNIKKGDIFSNLNTTIKGPGGGILPKYLEIIIGKKSNKKIKKDFPITWEHI